MARPLIRLPALLILGAGLTLPAFTAELCGCGPDFPDDMFVSRGHPDRLDRFDRGELGVLLPTYWRAHLLIAYRYLSGRPLTAEERASLPRSWSSSPGGTRADPLDLWRQARLQVPGAVDVRLEKWGAHGFSFFGNCTDSAFSAAVDTLQERIARFGGASPEVAEWLAGQDAVFANCSEGDRLPGPLPAAMPDLLQHDRQYQIAAALFYARRFEEAEAAFERISRTGGSPWREVAHLLVARSRIRRGTLEAPPGERFVASELERARRKLNWIVGQPQLGRWHAAARDLLEFVNLRLEPEAALRRLALRLTSERHNPRFAQDLTDYTWLMDRDVAGDDPLTRWIRTFQTASPGEALAAWRASRSLPMLLAAAVRLPAGAPEAPELVEALRSAPSDWPGYPSALFHRGRLLAGLGRLDEARRVLDEGLDSLPLEASSRNLFRELRLRLAVDLGEFERYGAHRFRRGGDQRPWGFGPHASRALTEETPLPVLAELALHGSWPPVPARELLQAAWVRAVLLDEWEVADRLRPALENAFPEARPHLEEIARARALREKRFVAALNLLRLPGWHLYVAGGLPREDAAHRLHDLRHNWWCPPAGQASTYDHYRIGLGADRVLSSLDPAPELSAASFLDQSQREQGRQEWRRLSALGAGPVALGRIVLDHELLDPDDPRLPEALHRVVRATRFGCGDARTGEVSREAFQQLHHRFPGNRWTKLTPYWYSSP